MDHYRLYQLRRGHITDVIVFAADTDQEALDTAQSHFAETPKELWFGSRLIAAFSPSERPREEEAPGS